MDRLIDAGYNLAHWIVAALATAIGVLVRKVFTAERKIELLEQHLVARDKQREDDREAIAEVRDSVKRIEGWIMDQAK